MVNKCELINYIIEKNKHKKNNTNFKPYFTNKINYDYPINEIGIKNHNLNIKNEKLFKTKLKTSVNEDYKILFSEN